MLRIEVLQSIEDVDAAAWDALVAPNDPFTEHAFLAGLEQSGSVGTKPTGWVPRHLLARDGERIVGAMPLYEKYDSYGEYIFDWGWANAALRAGLPYYPKLVSAVPFTPATGARCLVAADAPRPLVTQALANAALQLGERINASSVHVLFHQPVEGDPLGDAGYLSRLSYQFHWERRPGWESFADFLGALRAPARKAVRKERHTAAGHGVRLAMLPGRALRAADWRALRGFYEHTTQEKGAHAYLTDAFFAYMQRHLAHRVVAAMAHRDDSPVAGALYFTKGDSLYGRYWGTYESLDCLHFELCYYQPIEWALNHGVRRFEAGAQGEHKLKRGLLPNACHSAHWIRHPGLSAAIAEYLPREAAAVREEMAYYDAHSPFAARPESTA